MEKDKPESTTDCHGQRNPISLNIAGIHASILSIIIAVLSAYGLFFFGKLTELENRVLIEANQINQIRFDKVYIGPEKDITEDSKNPSELLDLLTKIVMGIPILDSKKDMFPLTDAQKGENVVYIMSTLLLFNPFPQRASLDQEGGINIYEQKAIKFKNIQAVRQWLIDLQPIVSRITWLATVHKNKLQEIIESLSEKSRKVWKAYQELLNVKPPESVTGGAQKDMEHQSRYQDPVILVDAFLHYISLARNVAGSTMIALKEYDNYRNTRINKNFFVISLLLAGISFSCGVLLPVVYKNPPRFFITVIPFGFYALVFFYVIWKVLSM